MSPYRVHLGRDVEVVGQQAETVELMGRVRLRPGALVELLAGSADSGSARVARVESWVLVELGSDGPMFRGLCRWGGPDGEWTTR